MGRLSNLKPTLSTLAPRLGYQPGDEQARNRQRAATQHWRHWYKTARWQRLRQQVLIRDSFICQKTGQLCFQQSPGPLSPVVNHKIPHRGDPLLFWSIDNLEVVTKAVHDSAVQREEKSGEPQFASLFPKWLKPSTIPLTIVCGPPASGKSTYAVRHAGPADLVIDLDVIASQLSGDPLHLWGDSWLHPALLRRNDLLGSLSRPTTYRSAWFIVSEPKAKHRDWWWRTLRPRNVIVLETSEAQCIANAAKDSDRDQKRTADAIVKWWFQYEPRAGDTVIR